MPYFWASQIALCNHRRYEPMILSTALARELGVHSRGFVERPVSISSSAGIACAEDAESHDSIAASTARACMAGIASCTALRLGGDSGKLLATVATAGWLPIDACPRLGSVTAPSAAAVSVEVTAGDVGAGKTFVLSVAVVRDESGDITSRWIEELC